MNGLIVYFTAYGTTQKYAEWIANEVNLEIRNYKHVTDAELQKTDFLIIGSLVMAHQLFFSKWLVKKESILKDKKLFFYSVSGARPGAKELDGIFDRSLPESLLKNANTYQFGGKMRYQDLSLLHKVLMWIGVWIEKNPETKAEMKKDMKFPKDNIDQDYIKPLVKDVKNYLNG